MKKIIDLLIEKNYQKKEAELLIRSGKIFINHEEIFTPSTLIKDNAILEIKIKNKYVSRGALKLLKGLEKFDINPTHKVCLDIGSSTGGFTEVLLEQGAKKIYALDSGTNQLHYKLRINEKIISLEKTNLKFINEKMFAEKLNLIVCDVSFISLKKVLEVLTFLEKDTDLILLIKPQFEADSNSVLKNGIVSKDKHSFIIRKVKNYYPQFFKLMQWVESPILGKKSKNIEYISHFKRR